MDLANCNTCHDQLVLHGGQRFNTEECVICHNPNASDAARRPADQAPVESIDFKRMIHRIHTGEELTQDFTIYGFGGTVTNFNEVRFPGDRRDCTTCHLEDTQQVAGDPAAGPASDTDAARLVHAAAAHGGRVPRLPRLPVRRRPCVRQHGPVRRGVRGLPRRQRRFLGRQGSRSVGTAAGLLLPFREGDRE